MADVFDDSKLDDESALASADVVLRRLAEAGARVRLEASDATEAVESAVATWSEDSRPRAVVAAVEEAYADHDGVEIDHLDGLTVSHADWWFNVRASNTEPLLRLNAEAGDAESLDRLQATVLALIRG